MSKLIVTISGPAGSGKTTLANFLAKSLRAADLEVTLSDENGRIKVNIDALNFSSELYAAVEKLKSEVCIATEET